MAEMSDSRISNSTQTQCSPPTKKARMQEQDTDAFKSTGTLTYLINRFRRFTQGEIIMLQCDDKVSVRGLTFGLDVWLVQKGQDHGMKVMLKCEKANGCCVRGDGSWSCLASLTLRIKTLLKSGEDNIYKSTHRFFSDKNASSLHWSNEEPLWFDCLMNPKNGFYNEKEDTVEVIAEISADAPVGVMELPKTDVIQVNEQTVFINKNQLAMHSPYFHNMFYNTQFNEGKNGEYKVNIEEPATVEHFKRMLEAMYPENKPLDDRCIEGVLHVANQFLVTDVEGKCVEFLREESTKSALFKYRVADKYGCIALRDHVLRKLKVDDFKKKKFMANMAEYVQLGPSAEEALKTRYDELFPPESDD